MSPAFESEALDCLEPVLVFDVSSSHASLCVDVSCRLSPLDFTGTTAVRQQAVLIRLKEGPAPEGGRVSLLDFSVGQDESVTVLFQESHSKWWQHVPLCGKHFMSLTETCAGIGAIGMGAETLGGCG